MFYDKEIELWGKSDPYTDDDYVYHEGKFNQIKTSIVDVQPYSTERLKKDYGYEIDVNKIIYCDPDEAIKISELIIYKESKLEIKKVIEWDDHVEIMCLEVI